MVVLMIAELRLGEWDWRLINGLRPARLIEVRVNDLHLAQRCSVNLTCCKIFTESANPCALQPRSYCAGLLLVSAANFQLSVYRPIEARNNDRQPSCGGAGQNIVALNSALHFEERYSSSVTCSIQSTALPSFISAIAICVIAQSGDAPCQ